MQNYIQSTPQSLCEALQVVAWHQRPHSYGPHQCPVLSLLWTSPCPAPFWASCLYLRKTLQGALQGFINTIQPNKYEQQETRSRESRLLPLQVEGANAPLEVRCAKSRSEPNKAIFETNFAFYGANFPTSCARMAIYGYWTRSPILHTCFSLSLATECFCNSSFTEFTAV